MSVESSSFAEAAKLFRENQSLGFSDCLILQTAKRNGYIPLGTLDKKLAKINGATKL